MSRNAASVTTSGYLQTPLILLVGEHVDPSTWCALKNLVDLRLENKSSSCHAMHVLHVDTQSRYSSGGFVVVVVVVVVFFLSSGGWGKIKL